MVADGAYSLPLTLNQVPVTEWKQFLFEGTAAINLQDAFLQVNPDLQKRTIYGFITPNIQRFGQTVYYANMEFYFRGQLIAVELWRSAAAVVTGDNRPNKNFLSSQQTVFTPMANCITVGFPTLANVSLVPYLYRNITCDLIRFNIIREAVASGATGRIFLGCRSELQISHA